MHELAWGSSRSVHISCRFEVAGYLATAKYSNIRFGSVFVISGWTWIQGWACVMNSEADLLQNAENQLNVNSSPTSVTVFIFNSILSFMASNVFVVTMTVKSMSCRDVQNWEAEEHVRDNNWVAILCKMHSCCNYE